MFLVSKLVHAFIHPLHVVFALAALGFLLRAMKLQRLGAAALWAAGGIVAVVGFTPLAESLGYAIENRVPAGEADLDRIAGVIVLGGSTGHPRLVQAHGTYEINDAAERLTTIVTLRRERPDLPVLVSGGSGRLLDNPIREPEITRLFLADMGVDPSTVEIEERSRNTWENAAYSAQMLRGRPGPWLLVTSAWHMPRALACFRKAGIDVIPYPVDYRIAEPSWTAVSPVDRFAVLDLAVSEIVGLVSYRLLGRTDALFPE